MTANEALDQYLKSLESKERAIKSRDIRYLCQKTSSVLYDWKKGRTPIPSVYRDKIIEAVGINIFENVAN